MFTATTITCLRQRGSAPHPGATAPTVRASPGSSCWRCSRRAARAAPSLHLRACCATRAGAPRPPRDRCGPSRAPRARPSPAQPHCPALRPSQPSRQPACLSTRPRRALALARVGVLVGDVGRHADRRSSSKESSPRLLVERLPEFTYSTNGTVAATLASSSTKVGKAPARNAHREPKHMRCGIEIAGRVRSAEWAQAAVCVRGMIRAPQTKKISRCRPPPLLGQRCLAMPLIFARHRLHTR